MHFHPLRRFREIFSDLLIIFSEAIQKVILAKSECIAVGYTSTFGLQIMLVII